MTIGRLLLAALVVLTTSGCGAAPHTRAAGAVSPLAVRAVTWNAASVDVGQVRAVADAGDLVTVFSDAGATVFASRARVATDSRVKDWRSGSAVAGSEGAPGSILGVAGDGRVYMLRGMRAFEDVTDRFGVAGEHVRAVAGVGSAGVAFLLPDGIAVSGGGELARYATPGGAREVVSAAGFVAEVHDDAVRVLDVARRSVVTYRVPGVTHAALAADGRLYVATARAVYAADARGPLRLAYDAGRPSIHAVVASGSAAWLLDGTELGLVQPGGVAETSGANLAPDATLAPSISGDVWVLARGRLERYTHAATIAGDAALWADDIAPVFARACASCHGPGGVSGTDLSTAAAWDEERNAIRARVVDAHRMPPAGHPLREEDRAAIARWLAGARAP